MITIRDSINAVSRLFEMPYLFTTADDFGLDDPDRNQLEYRRLSEMPYRTLLENETVVLGISTRPGLGEIFLLRKDEEALTYYVKYKKRHLNGLGNAVTQVAIWRRDDAGFRKITTHVFYNYLLEQFETIVSDAHQTQDGQRFWINRMGEAVKRGLTVGMIDQGDIAIYDGAVTFNEWIGRVGSQAWGDEDGVHDQRLFFISKRTFG